MKKKGVNIIAILAVVLVLVMIGVILALVLETPSDNKNSGGSGSIDLSSKVLELETIEQFREFSKSGCYECDVGEDQSGGSVYRVPVLGEETVVTYYFDEQGKTTDFQAFYFLNANISDEENMNVKEITVEELATAARDTVEKFCLMFGCGFVPDLYLTNADGTFTPIESDADFQSLKEGNAELIFSIRAQDGFYWELTISAEEDLISANICKYFNVVESMDYVANISLYEEE